MVVSLLFGLAHFVIDSQVILRLGGIGVKFALLVIIGFQLFLAYKSWKGRNWARVVFLVLALIQIYPSWLVIAAELQQNIPLTSHIVIQELAQIMAVVLLFHPRSNDWFREVKSQ